MNQAFYLTKPQSVCELLGSTTLYMGVVVVVKIALIDHFCCLMFNMFVLFAESVIVVSKNVRRKRLEL